MSNRFKSTESTEYDGIRKRIYQNGDVDYFIRKTVKGVSCGSYKGYESAREAAIMLDKWLLNHGEQPINVLKPLRKP